MHESPYLNFRYIPDHEFLVNLFNYLGSKIIAMPHVIRVTFLLPLHPYILLGRRNKLIAGKYMNQYIFAHHIFELIEG